MTTKASPLEKQLEKQLLDNNLCPFHREYLFMAPNRKFKADFAFPNDHLLIEVEGGIWLGRQGRHTNGSGYEKDCEKYNLAALAGWTVLRFTGKMIKSGEAIKMIKQAMGK